MSTNDLDFNALWQQQSAPKPDVKSMLEEVKAYQAKNKRKQWLLNTALTTTCLIIVCIWFYYQPQYITTKMGIVCALLAMIILLIVSNKTASDAITNESNSTRNYLRALIAYKTKQNYLQTKIMGVYFLLLSLGLGLYLYEYVSKGGVLFVVGVYTATFVWIAFNWFYLRKIVVKKQNGKLDTLIQRLKSIQD